MKPNILVRLYKVRDEWKNVNENDNYMHNQYYNMVKLNMMQLDSLLDPEWYNDDKKALEVAINIGYVELSLKLLKDEEFRNKMLSTPLMKPNEK